MGWSVRVICVSVDKFKVLGILCVFSILLVYVHQYPVHAHPSHIERRLKVYHQYIYSSESLNMSVIVEASYRFEVEYTERIVVGSETEVKLKIGNTDVTITVAIQFNDFEIEGLLLSGMATTKMKTRMDLGYDIGSDVIGVGELGLEILNVSAGETEAEFISGRFQIVGSIAMLKNIMRGLITTYGDAIGITNGTQTEDCIWLSNNLTTTRKFKPDNKGNITMYIDAGVRITTPEVDLYEMLLYLDNGVVLVEDLSPYSSNMTLLSVMNMKAKTERYYFERVTIVIWVVEESQILMMQIMPIIIVAAVVIILVVMLIWGKLKA